MNNIKLSIFTPTFNRAHKLQRLYDSLRKQTYKEFTWIIVDDGSTDSTRDLVNNWIEDEYLSIKYFYQKNAGKQRAYNYGIDKGEGDLFICIDSDDIYVPNAFEIISEKWKSIDNKDDFIAISYLSENFKGELIGSEFPAGIYKEHHFIMHNYFGIKGDKGMAFNLNKLKMFMFPVFDGETFTTEALLYNRMSIKYKTIYMNKCLEVKEYLSGGLSDKYISLLINNPLSASLYYNEFRFHKLNFKLDLKSRIYELRFKFHSGNFSIRLNSSLKDICFSALLFPVAGFFYLKDIISEK